MSSFSMPIVGRPSGNRQFSTVHFDLDRLGASRSPILLFDDFIVSGRPFGPHPHAGFSAITYVFEDSAGSLRSRDSLGNDIRIGAGGMVWLQAGRGALHEETPAEPEKPLHGLQFYVNLRAANKDAPPEVFWTQGTDVPAWQDEAGSRVRVVVGQYRDVVSPLKPKEPFLFLDLVVESRIIIDLEPDSYTLVYARDAVAIEADRKMLNLKEGQLAALRSGTKLAISAGHRARVLVLSGQMIDEPVHSYGPFVMNRPSDLNTLLERYQRGEMGFLEPVGHISGGS
jgi:redox-sensitive bicupin YhaK (pirin superfamily)